MIRFFIAGIMQGSLATEALHAQDYRSQIKRLLSVHFPDAEVYDPLADHSNSLKYNDESGRAVFYEHNRMCRLVDVVIAYVPEASMGTAIEMWEAYEHGRAVVVAISPLKSNWAIKYCSHKIYESMETFAAAVKSGEVEKLLNDSTKLSEKD